MTETATPAKSAGPPPAPPPSAESLAEKRSLAEKTLGELLTLMQVPAKLDVKDASDGGISVAVALEAELPGVALGRRSHFVDALQFLVNKLVNKPGTPRHWVALGIGAHPEPRGQKPARAPAPVEGPPPAVSAPVAARAQTAAAPARAPAPAAGNRPASKPAAPSRESDKDERTLEVPEDKALRAAALELAKKSSQLGRYYALVGLTAGERAEVLRGADGTAGVTLSAEGEGRNRRLVFTPAKPAPMPKRALPVDDEDFDDA